MRTFKLDKLVVDGMVETMQAQGQEVVYRVLEDDQEYGAALQAKFEEELAEFHAARTREDREKEWRQIKNVSRELRVLKGMLTPEQALQQTPTFEMASFAGRVYVEKVSVPEGSPWVEYYANEPERFPEERSA